MIESLVHNKATINDLRVIIRKATILDVPAILLSIMLNAPALQYSSVLPWTFGCIAFGPSNPHDPGPSAAAAYHIGTLTQLVLSSSSIEAAPLQTPCYIASGPSNPHDYGPPATVA